ncbi:MAG: hypothetical protein J6R99_00795 [Alphaproteobacteria bacterium]|nr:hypothetical protein [Alphaproteobacteria bacterium]
MKVKETSYGAPAKQILAIPDHYVAIARKCDKQSELATVEDGRYIVKAGTIYPSNDAKATGVVLNDYDVTDGEVAMAVVMHGFIQKSKLPVAPAEAAVTALKQITFLA